MHVSELLLSPQIPVYFLFFLYNYKQSKDNLCGPFLYFFFTKIKLYSETCIYEYYLNLSANFVNILTLIYWFIYELFAWSKVYFYYWKSLYSIYMLIWYLVI